MRNTTWLLCLLAAASLHAQTASVAPSSTPSKEPTIVLLHGKVFTADPQKKWAEAVAIRDERIVAVGTNAEIMALATEKTRKIDLGGRVVIPGINDAHTHQSPLPPHFQVSAALDPSWDDIRAAVASAADETPRDFWIFADIGPTLLRDPQVTADALDKLAPGRRVVIGSFTGHGTIYSGAALAALKATNATDPLGGWFDRDTTGKLTGRAWEYADNNLRRKIADSTSLDDAVDQLKMYAGEALQYGITTIQNMASQPLASYDKVVRHADVPLRIRMIRFSGTDATSRDVRESRELPATSRDRPLAVISGTKWILDGTPIEQGAALRASYANSQGTGRLNFPPQQVAMMVDEAVKNNDQLLLHTAGDRAVAVALDAINASPAAKTRRFRLEHGDGLVRDLIPAAKSAGVVVVQNPTHLPFRNTYPSENYMLLRTLVDAGIPVAIGSDGPMNPYLNIQIASTYGTEALTREQAVEAYTRTAAYAELQEKDKGTIAPGKLADIAVLSDDIFTIPSGRLPDTRSVLTIVDGKVAWDAGVVK